MSPTFRSIFAVVDGLLLFLALEGVFSAISVLGLGKSFDTPTPLFLGSYVAWALLAAVAGGYVAGRVAHRNPLAHGIALAVVLLPLVFFNIYKGHGNQHIAFVYTLNLLTPVAAIFGSLLYRSPLGASAVRRA